MRKTDENRSTFHDFHHENSRLLLDWLIDWLIEWSYQSMRCNKQSMLHPLVAVGPEKFSRTLERGAKNDQWITMKYSSRESLWFGKIWDAGVVTDRWSVLWTSGNGFLHPKMHDSYCVRLGKGAWLAYLVHATCQVPGESNDIIRIFVCFITHPVVLFI